jgi:hypothetical protein
LIYRKVYFVPLPSADVRSGNATSVSVTGLVWKLFSRRWTCRKRLAVTGVEEIACADCSDADRSGDTDAECNSPHRKSCLCVVRATESLEWNGLKTKEETDMALNAAL